MNLRFGRWLTPVTAPNLPTTRPRGPALCAGLSTLIGTLTEVARARYAKQVHAANPHVKEVHNARTATNWAKNLLPYIAKHAAHGVDGRRLATTLASLGKGSSGRVFGLRAHLIAEGERPAAARRELKTA